MGPGTKKCIRYSLFVVYAEMMALWWGGGGLNQCGGELTEKIQILIIQRIIHSICSFTKAAVLSYFRNRRFCLIFGLGDFVSFKIGSFVLPPHKTYDLMISVVLSGQYLQLDNRFITMKVKLIIT